VAPPGPPPLNLLTGKTPNDVAYEAVRSHLAKSDPASCAQDPPTPPAKMQLLTVHPSQPLVAYYLEEPQPHAPLTSVKLLQVQHLQTRNVLWTCYLTDLASMLFDYDPIAHDATKKFGHAIKTLGVLQSLSFFDASTLYFSGMADPSDASLFGQVERWQTLLVQFDKRIVMLNLRKGPASIALLPPGKGRAARNFYSPILCHLTKETGLNSNPSSNALPLTKSLLLLGCADGTFKCYDWKRSKLQKSIKGLGKNDWIVHLIAANRYPSLGDATDAKPEEEERKVRRFITLTKKGTAYLIEVVVSQEGIDIRPPLARFEGGAAPLPSNLEAPAKDAEVGHWEHQLLNYDADRDIFMWGLPSNKGKQGQKVFCWDLQRLQSQLLAEKGGKSVFKPEPTLVIQIPFEAEVAAFPAWSHPAFPDDAIVCAVITRMGDLHIMGATTSGTSGSATVIASAITSTSIRAVIQRDTGMVTGPILQLHFVGCASLWDSGVLLLGSNLGVVMVDFESQYILPGSLHNHFGAGLGHLGKSVLYVKHSSVVYGSIDAFKANPVGRMEIKNTYDVFESPAATHLPLEIQKRAFRLPPCFLPSPSGMYLCLYWNEEMRYEVLHVPSVLRRVSQRSKDGTSTSASVASGTGVSSFAWIGENNVYAVIHSPDAEKLGQASSVDAVTPTVGEGKDFSALSAQKLKDLTDIRNLGNNLKDLANVKDLAVNTTKGATKVVTSTAKIATGAAISTGKAGLSATKAVKGATVNATSKVVGTTASVAGKTAGVVGGAVHKTSKVFSFGLLGRGKKKSSDTESAITADDEEDFESKPTVMTPTPMMQPGVFDPNSLKNQAKKAYVEFKELVAVDVNQSAMSGTIAPATASSLGELGLRGGNRIPPRVLFGGPVLCVACRSDDEDGMAYFYTRKKGEESNSASVYVSSGPSMPYPDLVVWDDDGKLCAVVIQSRVAIYLSDQPDFVLLGTVRVGSPADPDGAAISVKFVHGVLYCCTRNSIECVFLGDTTSGGICHLDSHVIASTSVHTLPGRSILTGYSSLTPPTLPMPLNHPVVLGYQSGSLVVSTVRGLLGIPLCHPLLRIGTLLAAGQSVRAKKWFDAVPESDHEGLATFLERRGYPELAVELPGLSLETMVDFSMRHGYVDRLEEIVGSFGVPGLRSIDMGRSVSSSIFGPEEYGHSVIVCVGVYLLAHGKIEPVRRLASECLKSGEAVKDAFVLASLMLNIDRANARDLIGRVVQESEGSDDWAIGSFVRNHIMSPQSDRAS
jgi:hypothetical protein